MAVRQIVVSGPPFGGRLRLWTPPSWPADLPAPHRGCAVEWQGTQFGHPTSYALLAVHEGPDEATEAMAGQPFLYWSGSGEAEVVFGLAPEYGDVVRRRLSGAEGLRPALAAESHTGSSSAAFAVVASFLASAAHQWDSSDETISRLWADVAESVLEDVRAKRL